MTTLQQQPSRPALNRKKAKPFLKWAGGKTQLLSQFEALYPPELKAGQIENYVEPFIGGGAVFFEMAHNYPIKSAYLYDVNVELVLIYKVIQRHVMRLLEQLEDYSYEYKRRDAEDREAFYYRTRARLNSQKDQIDFEYFSDNWISRAATLLFLNRTCFNGLFRLNSQREFNVPHGSYKNPRIFDAANLQNASKALQIAEIQVGDFERCADVVDSNTFVYFDPPYRPLSKTASFTAYSQYRFGDDEQARLAHFFAKLDREHGAKLMLSNSDPSNEDPGDTFFDDLYRGFNIHRVLAHRMINSNGAKRGKVRELVITNYGALA